MNEPNRQREYARICDIQARLARSNQPSIASLYHEQSKRYRDLFVPPVSCDWDLLPALSRSAFKEYRSAERVSLPEAPDVVVSLNDVILGRRTVRSFAEVAMSLEQVATVLTLSYRIINPALLDTHSKKVPKRPVPSGGALYPLELYLVTLNVNDLPAGLYHYHPARHELEVLGRDRPRSALNKCIVPPNLPTNAAFVLCICGISPRNRFKYGELGYRLMLFEAGHVAQNVLLVAEALGLGGLPCCGFYDDRMHDYLGVDGVDEVCLYLIVLGRPSLHTGPGAPAASANGRPYL